MDKKQKLLEITCLDIMKLAEDSFSKYMKVDLSNLPKHLAKPIYKAREICLKDMKPVAKWCVVPIKKFEHDKQMIQLEGGKIIYGEAFVTGLKNASEVVLMAVTVVDYDKIVENQESVLIQFYVDAWASAIVEATDYFVKEQLKEEARGNNFEHTNYYLPGEVGVPIENHKEMFACLKLEEIGMVLADANIIYPLKSMTTIFGLSKISISREVRV